jgi:hypothetical protein
VQIFSFVILGGFSHLVDVWLGVHCGLEHGLVYRWDRSVMFRRRRLILRPTPKIVKLPRIQISLKPFITQILRLNNDRLNFQLFSLLLPREHLV